MWARGEDRATDAAAKFADNRFSHSLADSATLWFSDRYRDVAKSGLADELNMGLAAPVIVGCAALKVLPGSCSNPDGTSPSPLANPHEYVINPQQSQPTYYGAHIVHKGVSALEGIGGWFR